MENIELINKNRSKQIILHQSIKNIFHDHPDFMNRKIDLQFLKLVDSMLGNEKPLTLMELAGEIRAVKINIMEEQGQYAFEQQK